MRFTESEIAKMPPRVREEICAHRIWTVLAERRAAAHSPNRRRLPWPRIGRWFRNDSHYVYVRDRTRIQDVQA